MADRQIAEAESDIAKQRALIADMAANGMDTTFARTQLINLLMSSQRLRDYRRVIARLDHVVDRAVLNCAVPPLPPAPERLRQAKAR